MIYRDRMLNIHLHPILIIFGIIAFFTGTFIEFFIILFIVIVHELGHYTVARTLNWRIQSITLWVFGGVMITDEHGNKPIWEELLVTIGGPFQHLLIYTVIFLLDGFIPSYWLELIYFYNTIIFVFNLLPIWPLDGGKLLFLCLSFFMPFRQSYHFIIKFSMLLTVCFIIYQLFIYSFTLSSFFIMIFLFMENRNAWKHKYYVFIRFLLERYKKNRETRRNSPIIVESGTLIMEVFSKFIRDQNHTIYITDLHKNNCQQVIHENDCLHSFFHQKQYYLTIDEVVKQLK